MTRDSTNSVAEQNRLLSQLLSLISTPSKSQTPLVEVSDQVPAGRGLVFTQRIGSEQVLLTLPVDSLINVKSHRSFFHPDTLPTRIRIAGNDIKSSISKEDHRLSSAQLLSLLLARARIERDLGRETTRAGLSTKQQALQLFVETLPQTFDTVPLAWSLLARPLEEGETAETSSWKNRFFQSLLQALPPHSRTLQAKVRRRFEDDWHTLVSLRDSDLDLLAEPALLASNPDLARSIVKAIDVSTYLWAWLCVNSRCLFLPLGLADHADNFTLAPLLDMANHTSDPTLECKVSYTPDGGLQLGAPSKQVHPTHSSEGDSCIALPGDECFITYGPHSNEALLSEYGFVLPAQLTFAEDLDKDAASPSDNQRRWRGNRYVDVLMDEYIERLFQAQAADGEQKTELLQNRGYWGEFTIHPYPEPAHPSHRLIPALRLAALDLRPSAKVPSRSTKVAKVKAQSGVKTGRKRPFEARVDAKQDGSSDLDKWEATLTGHRDTVSDENEQQAHRILVDLCQARSKDTEEARRHLAAAQSILATHSNDAELVRNDRSNPPFEACALSLAFVQQLLDEEESVLRLVSQAAQDQVEW